MPVQILMPALSPTMTEGNLVRWLKAEGDVVKAGEVIAEIETDKATMEVEAVDEGVFAKIMVPAGTEGVKVNALIAILLEEGEEASSMDTFIGEVSAASADTSLKNTPELLSQDSSSISTASTNIHSSASGDRVLATPLARRIADQQQIDLKNLQGTGPRGRIIKADVQEATLNKTAVSRTTANVSATYGVAGYQDIPLNNMRKVIAKRLTESKQQVPHFYLSVDCVLDKLLILRQELNSHLEEQKLSVNDFVVRACALSLMKVPQANVSWIDGMLRQYEAADVSVAVAIEGGLITPVVKSAHQKSLKEISAEVKNLAERARAGKLMPEEFQGGTFTLSNLGMFGVKQFNAIINPPQACILAVGAGEQRPIVKDGEIQVATVMNVTLSVDHRVVDGAVGAQFIGAFKKLIEEPLQLLL